MKRTVSDPAGDANADCFDGADRWPAWAVPQVLDAVEIARRIEGGARSTAAELFRRWFTPVVDDTTLPRRPLAGVYRAAHAGSARRRVEAGVAVVERNDTVGPDGWWRTWGPAWMPTRSREHCVRLVLTPRTDRLADFVTTATSALIDSGAPWLLAVSTDPRRVRRTSAAVLYLPEVAAIKKWADDIEPLLLPVTSPLCVQVAPGIAAASVPGNGMSFGEHRSHLIALALTSPTAASAPLHAVADVFARHGLDPRHPHRS